MAVHTIAGWSGNTFGGVEGQWPQWEHDGYSGFRSMPFGWVSGGTTYSLTDWLEGNLDSGGPFEWNTPITGVQIEVVARHDGPSPTPLYVGLAMISAIDGGRALHEVIASEIVTTEAVPQVYTVGGPTHTWNTYLDPISFIEGRVAIAVQAYGGVDDHTWVYSSYDAGLPAPIASRMLIYYDDGSGGEPGSATARAFCPGIIA